jgi:hypothetical protein
VFEVNSKLDGDMYAINGISGFPHEVIQYDVLVAVVAAVIEELFNANGVANDLICCSTAQLTVVPRVMV